MARRHGPKDTDEPKDWRGRLKNARLLFRMLPRTFAVLWAAAPALTVVLGGITLVQALIPAGIAWIAKLIIDAVAHAAYRQCKPVTNIPYDQDWRHEMVPVFVRRAMREALGLPPRAPAGVAS